MPRKQTGSGPLPPIHQSTPRKNKTQSRIVKSSSGAEINDETNFNENTNNNNAPPAAASSARRKQRKPKNLMEIEQYQRTTELLMLKTSFQRLVRSICEELRDKEFYVRNLNFSWQLNALLALQEACEAFLVRLFEDCNLIALHCNRITIMKRDLVLVRLLKENK